MFSGLIEEIGVMADPLAHTYKIRIGIENTNRDIRPGMVCTAAIHVSRGHSGLAVPDRAVLVDEGGNNYVYVVDMEQKKAERRAVRCGRLLSNEIEILDGLNGSETIVVSGQHKLLPQAHVRIINP